MADKNLILVKTIKKYPGLYNHQLPEYFKKEITEKSWNEVSNETKLTVSECKEKWKNLRYSFVRSLKLNHDGSSKKEYYLKDEMEFVLPHVRALPAILTGPFICPTESESDEDNIDNRQRTSTGATEHLISDENKAQNIAEPPKKKTKATTVITNNGNKQTPYIPLRSDEEALRMFLLSLLPEVIGFSEPQMRSFRRRIFGLIDDIIKTTPFEIRDMELDLRTTKEIEIVKK